MVRRAICPLGRGFAALSTKGVYAFFPFSTVGRLSIADLPPTGTVRKDGFLPCQPKTYLPAMSRDPEVSYGNTRFGAAFGSNAGLFGADSRQLSPGSASQKAYPLTRRSGYALLFGMIDRRSSAAWRREERCWLHWRGVAVLVRRVSL